MVNILIFRTDRIGDLIATCPAIITIKKYFTDSKITLISSSKNYHYAQSLNIFHEVMEFPEKNILNKIKFINKLKKSEYDYIYIFDGKDRSILSSMFINSKIKVAITQKISPLHKVSKIKFFLDKESTNFNEIFQSMLDYTKVNTKIENYDFISKKKDNNFSKKILIDKYIHIHLDEKWFNNLYIRSYTNINPEYESFVQFINKISERNNVLITTGLFNIKLIDDLKNKFFNKVDDKIFLKKSSNSSIYLIFQPSFYDIESLLKNTHILISCHGSVTHAANSFDIIKIDILEKNMVNFYKRFTFYLKKHHTIYRSGFENLKSQIYDKISTLKI